jgi:hypothetical protein
VAAAAVHPHGAEAVAAALDVHRVRKALVILERRVTGDVAVLAARVLQHFPDGFERRPRAILRLADGAEGGDRYASRECDGWCA